jgi:hypothetical protein
MDYPPEWHQAVSMPVPGREALDLDQAGQKSRRSTKKP